MVATTYSPNPLLNSITASKVNCAHSGYVIVINISCHWLCHIIEQYLDTWPILRENMIFCQCQYWKYRIFGVCWLSAYGNHWFVAAYTEKLRYCVLDFLYLAPTWRTLSVTAVIRLNCFSIKINLEHFILYKWSLVDQLVASFALYLSERYDEC